MLILIKVDKWGEGVGEVFRIIDRFIITGRGTVYMVDIRKGADMHIGDILLDLRGNHFKVKGIEMLRRILAEQSMEDMPVGLLFELMDGVEACGNILIRDLQAVNFLFCNHPLYQRKVDEDYEEEYQTAGFDHPCALFSYEDLERGKLSLYGDSISGLTIYRGWMMKPEMYAAFYSLLEEKGIVLINTPKEYEKYHTLPGWYPDFAEETAESVWESEGKPEYALSMAKSLAGPYIVKDFVKSRKHEWYDACFIQDIADRENAEKIIRNFIARQGASLVGGIVLRRFEALKQTGFHERSGMPLSEEYRAFIYAGKIMMIDDYWDENGEGKISAEERLWIESIVNRVKSNFVTVDIARKEDGSLIIMELGDGQVSGLQQIKAEDFYKAFS